MADELREEHARGEPEILLTGGDGVIVSITREEAAIRMDAQGDRWELEIRTGELNLYDRKLIGAAPR
jgi:hypothetical protein